MIKLTRAERETIITYYSADTEAEVYTTDLPTMRRLERLCSQNPAYKLKKQNEYSKTYLVPRKAALIRLIRSTSKKTA